MKRVLMIAYHFPPLAGSSGIQRSLRFVQQLPQFGWQPLVLTAHERAYEHVSDDLLEQIPSGTVVRRAFALDAARHLGWRGRHLAALARPDRWISWRFDALRQGMRLIDEFKPQALWSTYPIATAHVIAHELQRRSGLPWAADFRDPMAQDGYPADPRTWADYRAIEERSLRSAGCSLFTTPSAARTYRQRYPEAADRVVLLENGYDEDTFADAERAIGPVAEPLNPGAVTLLHSGIVYPDERDPSALFRALSRLLQEARIAPGRLKLRFRAPVSEALLRRLAAELGIESLIEVLPPIGYGPALQEMLRADALLVLQAANCNEQIPAKVYEYLRARRPMLCLSDARGDTVAVLRSAGLDAFAALDSADEIAQALPAFLARVEAGRCAQPEPEAVRRASRRERTRVLAQRLDALLPEAREPQPEGIASTEPAAS
jgi:glycosyltransferase involved in cell wall biosynthesis